jgi:hypothetical protein
MNGLLLPFAPRYVTLTLALGFLLHFVALMVA